MSRLPSELIPRFQQYLAAEDARDAANLTEVARRAAATQVADGSWEDIDYADDNRSVWKTIEHLERVRALSSWALPKEDRERSQAAAIKGLQYWFAADFFNPNWWYNQIGAPARAAESLVLLGSAFPAPEQGRKMLERCGPCIVDLGGIRPTRWTGANQLWIAWNIAMRAALFSEIDSLEKAVADVAAEIHLSSRNKEGLQVDGSFHQHGPLLYNNGYGLAFLGSCHAFIRVLADTPWAVPADRVDLLAEMILDGNRWMIRGDSIQPCTRDRETVRHPGNRATRLVPVLETLLISGASRRGELEDLASAIRAQKAPGTLAGSKMFYRSDFFSRQHADYYIAVRMSSERTKRTEFINTENRLAHHLADGVTTLMRSGAEYEGIYPIWDWQKLPGTTALQTIRDEPPYSLRRRGSTHFVGGVCDGQFGGCVQHMADPYLEAHKAWFFGPEYVICLGAGISSSFAGEVVTVLDQSICRSEVTGSGLVRPIPAQATGKREEFLSPGWLRHDGWTFHLLNPALVRVTVEKRRGSWRQIGPSEGNAENSVFKAWISHGEAPLDQSYAYAIFPTDPGELTQQSSPFEVLANTPDLQAVYHRRIACLQVFFRVAGSFDWPERGRIEVTQPCGVMLTLPPNGEPALHVADITQNERENHVRFSGPTSRFECRIQPPAGDFAGATVRAELAHA